MTVKEILAESGHSKDELGKRVHAQLESSESDIPKPRSLAAKIGQLERGNSSWWQRRETYKQALADILEVSVAELFPMLDKNAGMKDTFSFDSFPQMSPLNLRKENPCQIAFFSPLRGAGQRVDPLRLCDLESSCVWCLMPFGAGKTLLTQWYKLRFRGELVALLVQNQEELEQHLSVETEETKKKLLILDLNCEIEPRMGAQLEGRGRIIVFASVGLPKFKESTKTLEEPTQTNGLGFYSIPQEEDGERWLVLRWVFFSDWRERFVSWCAGRLGEDKEKFHEKKVIDWLEMIDPLMDKFSSPGELLPLFDFIYEEGMRVLRKQKVHRFAKQWLQGKMSSFKSESDSSGAWLDAFGVEAVEALLKRRWSDSSVSWRGELPCQTWARWLPQNSLVGDGDVSKEILQIAEEGKKEKRQDLALNAIKKLEQPKSEIVIKYLQKSLVFRIRISQQLEIHPKWLEEALVQETVQHALEKESPEIWGRWWVASDRRSLVDRTLDALEDEAFERLIEKVIEAFDKGVLGTAGAVEAMFSAVARRFQPELRELKEKKPWSGNKEVLWELWDCQESLFCERYKYYHEPPLSPLLRDILQDSSWIADSWSWSIWCPKPARPLNERVKGMFPGWFDSFSLLDLGNFYVSSLHLKRSNFTPGATFWSRDWLTMPSGDTSEPEFHDWRILRLAPKVLKCCKDKSYFKRFPSLLLPALVLSENREEWSIKEQVGTLLKEIYLWKYVQYCMDKLSFEAENKEKIANFIFSSYLSDKNMSILYAFENIRVHYPHAYTFLSDYLSVNEFEKHWFDYLSHSKKNEMNDLPKSLPDRLGFAAVISYISHLKDKGDISPLKNKVAFWDVKLHGSFPEFSKEYELKILDSLIEILAENNELSFVMERYWKLDPQKAMELTLQSLSKSPSTKESVFWVHSTPNTWLEHLIGGLESYEEKKTIPWLHSWSVRKMREAPMWADALYKLFLSTE